MKKQLHKEPSEVKKSSVMDFQQSDLGLSSQCCVPGQDALLSSSECTKKYYGVGGGRDCDGLASNPRREFIQSQSLTPNLFRVASTQLTHEPCFGEYKQHEIFVLLFAHILLCREKFQIISNIPTVPMDGHWTFQGQGGGWSKEPQSTKYLPWQRQGYTLERQY